MGSRVHIRNINGFPSLDKDGFLIVNGDETGFDIVTPEHLLNLFKYESTMDNNQIVAEQKLNLLQGIPNNLKSDLRLLNVENATITLKTIAKLKSELKINKATNIDNILTNRFNILAPTQYNSMKLNPINLKEIPSLINNRGKVLTISNGYLKLVSVLHIINLFKLFETEYMEINDSDDNIFEIGGIKLINNQLMSDNMPPKTLDLYVNGGCKDDSYTLYIKTIDNITTDSIKLSVPVIIENLIINVENIKTLQINSTVINVENMIDSICLTKFSNIELSELKIKVLLKHDSAVDSHIKKIIIDGQTRHTQSNKEYNLFEVITNYSTEYIISSAPTPIIPFDYNNIKLISIITTNEQCNGQYLQFNTTRIPLSVTNDSKTYTFQTIPTLYPTIENGVFTICITPKGIPYLTIGRYVGKVETYPNNPTQEDICYHLTDGKSYQFINDEWKPFSDIPLIQIKIKNHNISFL